MKQQHLSVLSLALFTVFSGSLYADEIDNQIINQTQLKNQTDNNQALQLENAYDLAGNQENLSGSLNLPMDLQENSIFNLEYTYDLRNNRVLLAENNVTNTATDAHSFVQEKRSGSLNDENNTQKASELSSIVVTGQREQNPQQLNANDIAKRPTRNGNITEILRTNPAVNFSRSSNSGYAAGEIKPDDVSFHGMPYYQNNFQIDGLSNNDIMNPGASNGLSQVEYSSQVNSTVFSLPAGNPQSFYVDSSLVDNIKVYDSNIPAKYGRFVGGVVDAKIKEPNLEKASGKIAFRTTRDNWTQFHYTDLQDPMTGDASNDDSGQPEFVKQSYHFDINQPINDKLGFLFAYDRTQSKIPKTQPMILNGGKENERRLSQTFLLKGLYKATDSDDITASIMYSPHSDRLIPTNSIKDGSLNLNGGGWQSYIDWKHRFEWGEVDTKIAYADKRNEREWTSDGRYIQHANVPASFGWCSTKMTGTGTCTAREGGQPTEYSKNTTWTLSQDWHLNSFQWGKTEHNIDFGALIEQAHASFERTGDNVTYYSQQASRTGFDLTNCIDCDKDKGYSLVRKVVYPKTHTKVGVNSYGLYFQDEIAFNRFKITPGVRMDYDEFFGNTNIAPRLNFSADILNHNHLKFFGGANRYYSGNMVYYALRQALPKGTAYGDTTGKNMRPPHLDWDDPAVYKKNLTNGYTYESGKLDTPYSDELSAGLSSKLGNNNITLKYVYRQGKDLFKQGKNANGDYVLTNDGRSTGRTLSLQVASNRPYHLGMFDIGYNFGAKYFRTKNNNRYTYDNTSFEEQYDWKAIVDGQLLNPREIPALDFNQKWSAYLQLDTAIPKWGFSWSHILNVQDGYKAYKTKLVNCPAANAACGNYIGRAYEYQPTQYSDSLTLDWRFNWAIPVGKKTQKVDLTLDVLNVFNNKNGTNIGSSVNGSNGLTTGYETGRQFWLGAGYRW